MQTDFEFKKAKLEALEERQRLRKNLPHLYGWKNYPWQREFLDCRNRTAFITAANQIGKSSIQIRRLIDWATDVKKWPSLWGTRQPNLFWYIYPDKETATQEFDTKWVQENLPRGEMKNHPIYGWKETRDSKKQIVSLRFNSGVVVYFKTYTMDASHLQAGTVYYVACDEEMPEDLWDELNLRRNGCNGFFSMVFTATLGQELWRQTMEPGEKEVAKFPEAWKRQISLFDCQKFDDGSDSHIDEEYIRRTISMCKNDAEVLKRVYGRFVQDSGLKYGSFQRSSNVISPRPIPGDWLHFVGIDIGSGGKENHPSTISFIAMAPDYSMGIVYKHWRGDSELTTMSDVANKYIEMRAMTPVTGAYYDYHAKDFKTITDRMGLNFQAAEKSHEIGEQVINTLFKNKMLFIFDIPECEPIIRELLSLLKGTDKRRAKDDSIDSVRYGVTKIPFDWTRVGLEFQLERRQLKPLTSSEESMASRLKDRERMFKKPDDDSIQQSIDDELESWGELYDV